MGGLLHLVQWGEAWAGVSAGSYLIDTYKVLPMPLDTYYTGLEADMAILAVKHGTTVA